MAVALFVACTALLPRDAVAATDPVSSSKTKVKDAEAQVQALAGRLSVLLQEYEDSNQAAQAASGDLAVARMRLAKARANAAAAKTSLNSRAREAYMRGLWGEAKIVTGSQTVAQMLSYAKFLGASMSKDAAAYAHYSEAAAQMEAQANAIDASKQHLAAAADGLEASKREIEAALATQQLVLSQAQAELTRLQAERQRQINLAKAEMEALRRRALGSPGLTSPAVLAMRSARQKVLDEKLAALLAWYAPGFGNEPFMPTQLSPTGIVTIGKSSWYGGQFDGQRASSGATYHMEQLTAASLVLPFGTLLKVTLGSKSVVVVITDRGPYVVNRVLDLSAGAAQAIGLTSRGVAEVRMEIVVPKGPAPAFP